MTSKPVNYLIFLKKGVGFIQNLPQIMWINGVFDHGQGALPHPVILTKEGRTHCPKLRPVFWLVQSPLTTLSTTLWFVSKPLIFSAFPPVWF
jgi:hypothetical protein